MHQIIQTFLLCTFTAVATMNAQEARADRPKPQDPNSQHSNHTTIELLLGQHPEHDGGDKIDRYNLMQQRLMLKEMAKDANASS